MKTSQRYLEAYDTLSMRVHQASGVVNALLTIYTEQQAKGMVQFLTSLT